MIGFAKIIDKEKLKNFIKNNLPTNDSYSMIYRGGWYWNNYQEINKDIKNKDYETNIFDSKWTSTRIDDFWNMINHLEAEDQRLICFKKSDIACVVGYSEHKYIIPRERHQAIQDGMLTLTFGLAATNRIDIVDEALLRRFSVKHEIKDMTPEELSAMIHQYVRVTDTEKYVNETDISGLVGTYRNPGQAMPELIKLIGKGIYEEKKDELTPEPDDDNDEKLDLWEVTYTWKTTISAETEEDAIMIARNNRGSYSSLGEDIYSAKRAEFIYTQEKKR